MNAKEYWKKTILASKRHMMRDVLIMCSSPLVEKTVEIEGMEMALEAVLTGSGNLCLTMHPEQPVICFSESIEKSCVEMYRYVMEMERNNMNKEDIEKAKKFIGNALQVFIYADNKEQQMLLSTFRKIRSLGKGVSKEAWQNLEDYCKVDDDSLREDGYVSNFVNTDIGIIVKTARLLTSRIENFDIDVNEKTKFYINLYQNVEKTKEYLFSILFDMQCADAKMLGISEKKLQKIVDDIEQSLSVMVDVSSIPKINLSSSLQISKTSKCKM